MSVRLAVVVDQVLTVKRDRAVAKPSGAVAQGRITSVEGVWRTAVRSAEMVGRLQWRRWLLQ